MGLFSRTTKKSRKKPAKRATAARSAAIKTPRASTKKSPRNAVYAAPPSRRRAPTKRKKPTPHSKGFFRRLLTSRRFWGFTLRMGMACFLLGGITLAYYARNLPDIRTLNTIHKQQGITIETAQGRVVANYGDVYGRYLTYEDMPKPLIQAVLATEDRRFFKHSGVDYWGIVRAALRNMLAGHVVQGASTITQQVAKNVFLTPERTFSRKIQEVMLAFWLEGRFSKKEILAIYLNRVYLGAGAYGVDAAAHRYFNKSATELNLPESALMAGLLKAPSRYAPTANPERARGRMHQVLLNMVDADYLTPREAKTALASFAKTAPQGGEGSDIRYFTDWVMDDLPHYVGNVNEDLIVTTTVDPRLQTLAQDALQTVLSTDGDGKRITQGAMVAMQPDGAVRALIGGMGYSKSQYNRAVQARRQPGSVFKLFVYLAALEAGLTPHSKVLDAPVSMQVGNKVWTPENYTEGYKGEIPMVAALRNSLNTVSVRLTQYAGVRRVAQMAMRLGVPKIPARPSIALGSVEANLLDMTGAYAHLAHEGRRVKPYGILMIRNRKGDVLYQRSSDAGEPVLGKGTVAMMNYMLLDVVRLGTGQKAFLSGRDVAGKTGTSQNYKDAWFIGFTPQLVGGVWVGNDDNSPMEKVTGGAIPALIWHHFMQDALQGMPPLPIPNRAESSEGLLPWLFGSSAQPVTTRDAATSDAPSVAASPATGATPASAPMVRPAPATTPFQVLGGAPTQPQTAPPPARTPTPPPPRARPPAPAATPASDDPLSADFWNQLIEKVPVPSKDKVEYRYPSEGKR